MAGTCATTDMDAHMMTTGLVPAQASACIILTYSWPTLLASLTRERHHVSEATAARAACAHAAAGLHAQAHKMRAARQAHFHTAAVTQAASAIVRATESWCQRLTDVQMSL